MICVDIAAALKPASTPSPAAVRLLKLAVVSNATARGTLGPSPGSEAAVRFASSAVRTAASTTPLRAAVAILALTMARLARKASVTAGIIDCSWATSGALSAASAIRSTVFLSSAFIALGALPGAAWCSRPLSISLDWLYSSSMPSRWPYSCAAITLSFAP